MNKDQITKPNLYVRVFAYREYRFPYSVLNSGPHRDNDAIDKARNDFFEDLQHYKGDEMGMFKFDVDKEPMFSFQNTSEVNALQKKAKNKIVNLESAAIKLTQVEMARRYGGEIDPENNPMLFKKFMKKRFDNDGKVVEEEVYALHEEIEEEYLSVQRHYMTLLLQA